MEKFIRKEKKCHHNFSLLFLLLNFGNYFKNVRIGLTQNTDDEQAFVNALRGYPTTQFAFCKIFKAL